MELKNLVFLILLLAFVTALGLLFLVPGDFISPKQKSITNFSLQTFGRIGDTGYAIYNVEGEGSGTISLISLKEKPTKKIFLMKDSGVGMERFEDFGAALHKLDPLGYNITLVNPFSDVTGGVVVVPTGAMPKLFLDRLEAMTINIQVVYIGAKDLIISGGVKRQQWYDSLPDSVKSKMIVIESTTDDMLNDKSAMASLLKTLQENGWAATDKKEILLPSTGGNHTITVDMGNASYLRLISQTNDKIEVIDSGILTSVHTTDINATQVLFPWEKLHLSFDVEKSNGTVYVVIEKNGNEVIKDKWQRVSEGNVFIKSYKLNESGTYLIKVIDNSGIIGGATTRVKDLQIIQVSRNGYEYLFRINVDGKPLRQGIVKVSLNNSTKSHDFYVIDGILTISAKLEKGSNAFHFTLLGTEQSVTVENNQEEVLDIYFRYGIPGLFVILLVYGIARFLRKPIYVIRVSDWSGKIRKELKISADNAREIFMRTRNDLGITGPLTAQEYSIGLKRYATEGAEITEGNIEQVLKQLSKSNLLEGYDGYYQLAGEGNVKKNMLKRTIRDELIKKGIKFEVIRDKFITPHYEVGFFGDRFEKKGFVIFDNEVEMRATLSKLNERTKATVSLQRFNNKIEFITKDKLEEAL